MQDGPPLGGIDAIGIFDAATGLAEAARRSLVALAESGVQISLCRVDLGVPRDPLRLPRRLATLPTGRSHDIALCSLNVNELQNLDDDELHRPGRPSYVIGTWYWELPEMPAWVAEQARRVDEVWVTSPFVARAFRRYVEAPVTTVPAVVTMAPPAPFDRGRVGADDHHCLFLFSFDARSGFARKNPWAVIAAYREAFSEAERRDHVRLVMKSNNLAAYREGGGLLEYELERAGGVVVDDELSPEDMSGLLSACDVYVSLHRAEGFGLGMAEAMYLGRPVIATHYSGNVEFTTAQNSLPVPYHLREVSESELRFNPGIEAVCEPGMHWAEPDIAQASAWMRYCYENPEARTRIGARGAATVRARFSPESAAAAMTMRLLEIEAMLAARR